LFFWSSSVYSAVVPWYNISSTYTLLNFLCPLPWICYCTAIIGVPVLCELQHGFFSHTSLCSDLNQIYLIYFILTPISHTRDLRTQIYKLLFFCKVCAPTLGLAVTEYYIQIPLSWSFFAENIILSFSIIMFRNHFLQFIFISGYLYVVFSRRYCFKFNFWYLYRYFSLISSVCKLKGIWATLSFTLMVNFLITGLVSIIFFC
jgi:hypothetical protein